MIITYKECWSGRFVAYAILSALVIYLALNQVANGLLVVSALLATFVVIRDYKTLTSDLSRFELLWIFVLLFYPLCFLYAFILHRSQIDSETFVEFFRISFLVMMVFLVVRKSSALTVSRLKLAISLFTCLTGTLGILYWLLQDGGRISVGTPLINMYALLMTFAAGQVMFFCIAGGIDDRLRRYYMACFFIGVGGVFASGSKSAILALICIFLALSIQAILKNRRRLIQVLILFSPLILFGMIMNPFSRIEAMLKNVELFSSGEMEIEARSVTSTGQRIQMYQAAITAIQGDPLLGNGTWRLGDIFPDQLESGELSITTERYVHVHNELLQAWMTRGIPGVLMLMLLFLTPLWAVRSRDVFRKTSIYITLFVYLVFALFEAPLNPTITYTFFMIIISLLLACRTGGQSDKQIQP